MDFVVSDLRYGNVAAWPPAWTSTRPVSGVLTGQVDPILEGVTIKHGGLEIDMTLDGNSIRGLLLWDGGPSVVAVKDALDGFLHRSLREAADADIAEKYVGPSRS